MSDMRIALAIAVTIALTPATAWAGNQNATPTPQTDQARKPTCDRPTVNPRHNSRAPKTDCRASKPVPPIVDPTPTFIL